MTSTDSTAPKIVIWPNGHWVWSDDRDLEAMLANGYSDDYAIVPITSTDILVQLGMDRGEAESLKDQYGA